jgi:hypothetical protein
MVFTRIEVVQYLVPGTAMQQRYVDYALARAG